jgi:cell fate (sporulation/competence/biofilm development) regulator YmcA (YheA/YmcA/DUF963 family)
MNRDEYLNSCAKYLGRLAYEIRAQNAVGRFDINSVAEDFFVPILKVLFDCPELQNQNEIQQNFPSIDLGCRNSRISFQITTDASSDKIVKTLEKFREHQLEKNFDHVYIITITEKQSSYTAKSLGEEISKLPISFSPSKDILDVNDILSRIQHLETDKLERIEAYLASEFTKRDEHLRFREQFDKFLEFSQSKIEVEKKTKKYIPSIFVETHKTKEEMRLFANPLFFCRKVVDLLRKLDYSSLNTRLRLANEPELTLEFDIEMFATVPSTFDELKHWSNALLDVVGIELQKVAPLSWYYKDYGKKYEPINGLSENWLVVRFPVESISTGICTLLRDITFFLDLMRMKIFLITGMAGQGKTNFVCELIENQFRPFEIPCIFIPARELNSYPSRQRIISFISNNRYAPDFANIHEYFSLFDSIANECGKPFLIVIDGINEINALEEFNDELKDVCNSLSQYEFVKIIITCRSEFFDEKYASILNEPFSTTVYRVMDLRSKMSNRSKKRLLKSYLTYFNVTGHLSNDAQDFLKNDLLLLRIFCERHEGEDIGYVSDIYKGDLFEDFLLRKLKSFPENLQTKAFPTLLKIASAMLAADDFAKLSVRDFSEDEQEIVKRLVAEDIVLRQELAVNDLRGLGDLTISFTYDELRDFIIAYKLVDEVKGDDAQLLQETLSRLPGRPILEGVFKYVYLLARKLQKIAAITACEGVENFIEHFSLNAHLLPPPVQNEDDVARIKAILSDTSAPERTARITSFLLGRGNAQELLNINILIDHLNDLETDSHQEFIRTIFSDRYDFRSQDWLQRIDKLVESVCDEGTENGLIDFAPEWLPFFLHAASCASWFERERVSTLFKNFIDQTNCREAMNRVGSANSQAIQILLSDIKEPEEDN